MMGGSQPPSRAPVTIKRRIADALVASFDGCARLLGRRFYRQYLDDINRRFNDRGDISVHFAGRQLRFVCPNQLTRWRAETLFEKEPATIAWIDSYVKGAVMWDIGANIGIYALYAAVARNARVLAFEPAPATFALLAKNIEINRLGERVAAFPIALGDARRIGTLNLQDTLPGSAGSEFGDSAPDAPVKLDCLGYSIDRFIADFAPPFPEHVKIDVDGIEDTIVRGARETLADRRLKSLSIEIDERDHSKIAFVQSAMAEAGFAAVGVFRSPMFTTSPAQNYQFARTG